jgi:hypothetical protein
MEENGTRNITVTLFPFGVTFGNESIGFQPPSSEVVERDILFRISASGRVSDRDSPFTSEDLHDTECDVLYVHTAQFELAINFNPREKIGLHKPPGWFGKDDVCFGFRLGYHILGEAGEVHPDHLTLSDIR